MTKRQIKLQHIQEEFGLTDEETAELAEIADRHVESVRKFLQDNGLDNRRSNVRLAKEILGIPSLEEIAEFTVADRGHSEKKAYIQLIAILIFLVANVAFLYLLSPQFFALLINLPSMIAIVVFFLVICGLLKLGSLMISQNNKDKIAEAREKQNK